MTKQTELTRHPISAAYGEQSDEEFAALCQSIEVRGYDEREPILALEDGQIVDGWHRYLAACEVTVDPVITQVAMSLEEICNLARTRHTGRRNLTPGERAKADVKAKQAAGYTFAKQGNPADADNDGKRITTDAVAKDADVSTATAKRAIQDAKNETLKDPFAPDAPGAPDGTTAEPAKPRKTPSEKILEEEGVDETLVLLKAEQDRSQGLSEENDSLKERLAIIEAELDESGQAGVKEREKDSALIATLKSQNADLMSTKAEQQREIKNLKQALRRRDARIAELEKGNAGS